MRFVIGFVMVVLAGPAFATTGKELWQNWQMRGGTYGWYVRDSQVTDLPNGVRVDDLMVVDSTGLAISLDSVSFTDGPNGEVRVAFGPKAEVLAPATKKPLFSIESSGLVALFKEWPGGFAIAADQVALAGPANANKAARLSLDSVTGGFTFEGDDNAPLVPVGFTLHVGEIAYNISDIADPARVVLINGKMPEVDLQVKVTVPHEMIGPDDLSTSDVIKLGATLDLTMTNGPMQAHFNANGSDVNAGGLACKLTFTMDKGGFALRDACGDAKISLKGPKIPGEAEVTLKSVLAQFTAPVNSMATPGMINMMLKVVDAQANAAIWELADAKNAVPHDPMNLTVDIGMLGRWDIFDEATTQDFKPDEMTLRQFDLSAAGVTAAFSGRATINPVGGDDDPFKDAVLDGRVSGLNRLLNAVAAAGLIPAGNLFPVRAGMAMIFNPGQGEDVQTTHVETKADGSIFVNGVQMK